MNSLSKPIPTDLKILILEALSEVAQAALAQARAEERTAVLATMRNTARLPLPFWELSDSISPEIAK